MKVTKRKEGKAIDGQHLIVLVRRWKFGGDADDAFYDIQREFDGSLRRFVSRMVGPQHADDVVQETYHRAHRYRKTLREEHKLGPWLMRIARTQCNEWLKRNAGQRSVELPGEQFQHVIERYSAHHAFSHMMDEVTLRLDIERSLSRLPAIYREAVELHYLHELPVSDIAKLLAMPTTTVKWRIHRGLELCRVQMLEYQVGKDHRKETQTND